LYNKTANELSDIVRYIVDCCCRSRVLRQNNHCELKRKLAAIDGRCMLFLVGKKCPTQLRRFVTETFIILPLFDDHYVTEAIATTGVELLDNWSNITRKNVELYTVLHSRL